MLTNNYWPMKEILFSILFLSLVSCSQKSYKNPHVLIKTELGNIEVELYPGKAPATVTAFLANTDAGLFDNSSFYRVIKNDNVPAEYNSGLIQGGIFKSNPQGQAQVKRIVHESPRQTGLTHSSGTISMARTTPGSATSEFFICIGDQPQFDSSSGGNYDGLGYAAFGKVFEGMKVVRAIQNKKSIGESFQSPIKIISIKKL
jgi:peptidyl-prolyl cis-trans isomerase A (cyclophilin A)